MLSHTKMAYERLLIRVASEAILECQRQQMSNYPKMTAAQVA